MTKIEDHIYRVYQERQQKYSRRMQQGRRVREILTNNMDTTFRDIVKPGEEPVVGNLIWAAARTIAQRVGRPPRLDIQPNDLDATEKQKERCERHEHRLDNYNVLMNVAATRLQAAYWLVTHDMAPLVITPNPAFKIPVIEVRDPMTCFPGTVWPHKPEMVDVLFASRMTPWAATQLYPNVERYVSGVDEQVDYVVMGEFFTGDALYIVMLEPVVALLDTIPNPLPGRSLCFLTRGFSPDLDFHGQFDHVVPALVAQAKLFSLVMAYANQQVAAETVVIGEVSSNQGKWATGPGAVNQITPMPGAQANKLTNNMSVQVFNELDRLERAIRLGGQFPAQLSGEPVASIATGRGLEQLSLTVDDNVAYWQSVLDDAFMRAYACLPEIARKMGSPGSDDFTTDVTCYVRSLSGADPAETVRLLQLQGAKNLSRITIMDRLPEVDAPMKEMQRLDVDDMRMTLIRSIEQQMQPGPTGAPQLSPDVVAKMIQKRKQGEEVEDIWEQIQQMQQEQAQQAMQAAQAGMPGGGPAAGAPPRTLQDILNPLNLAGAAQAQSIRAARTGPETRALQAGTPNPGAAQPASMAVPGGQPA